MELEPQEIATILTLIGRQMNYYTRKEQEARTEYRRSYWQKLAADLDRIREKLEAAAGK